MDYGASCTTHICSGLPGRSCIWKQDAACHWSVTYIVESRSYDVCKLLSVCVYTVEADSMLVKERSMLALPGAPLTVDFIDEKRKKSQ